MNWHNESKNCYHQIREISENFQRVCDLMKKYVEMCVETY